MTNFYESLINVLKQDDRFFTENGIMLKNAVYEASMQMDENLIRLLLTCEDTKKQFFKNVNEVMVFDKIGFGWVINNRQFLSDSYTRFKNKIGLTDENGELISASGKVELVFPYKDCVLEGGQTKEDQKRKEIFYNESLAPDEVDRLLYPKVFTGAKRYSFDSIQNSLSFENNDNLIIKGNNLLALASILKKYEGRIKCIYIDPPYNTKSDSFGYNDNFKHSTWLTFMKNRLSLAYKLLSPDGILWVQTDDIEVNYLGVLLDELFGRENFINLVTVKTKIGGVSGSSEGKSLKDATEFIQVYAKDKSQINLEPVYAMTPVWDYIQEYIEQGKSWKYTSVLTELGERSLIREDVQSGRRFYHYPNAKSVSVNQYAKEHNMSEEDVYNSIPDKIFQTTNAQSSIRTTVMEETKKINTGIVSIEYIPTKGKNKNQLTEVLYTSTKRMFMFLSDMLTEDKDGTLLYKEKLSTLWDNIQYNNLSKEGKVDFPNGKKPEKLIQNIIEMSTYKGDYVLDFFGGSGSTAAVAHKLERKWITCEQMDSQIDIMIERLKNVVNGIDDKGISIDVDWKGGDSFICCELAKSNQIFVDEIEVANSSEEILEIYNRIIDTGFISSKVTPKEIDLTTEDFSSLSLENKKLFLMELIDKNLLYVNYCDIDDEDFSISEEDKIFTRSFYEGV